MNKDRLSAELPSDMATWLTAHGSDDTWEQIGRDLAVSLGRRLLAGDPGSNPLSVYVHRTAASPAIRHVADEMRRMRRLWSAHRVTRELIKYLELWSAQKYIERRLSKPDGPAPLLNTAAAA